MKTKLYPILISATLALVAGCATFGGRKDGTVVMETTTAFYNRVVNNDAPGTRELMTNEYIASVPNLDAQIARISAHAQNKIRKPLTFERIDFRGREALVILRDGTKDKDSVSLRNIDGKWLIHGTSPDAFK